MAGKGKGKGWAEAASRSMGGDSKPAKVLSHVSTEKTKSGSYIHTHHHTHPEHHPAEKHTSPDDKAMLQHMMASMGSGASPDGDPTAPGAAPDSPAAQAGAATTADAAAPAAPAQPIAA